MIIIVDIDQFSAIRAISLSREIRSHSTFSHLHYVIYGEVYISREFFNIKLLGLNIFNIKITNIARLNFNNFRRLDKFLVEGVRMRPYLDHNFIKNTGESIVTHNIHAEDSSSILRSIRNL